MPAHLVLCTCPNTEVAHTLARTLVDERLAACVNVVPAVQSVYRWQGAVQVDDEVLLLIKTVSAQLKSLQERIQSLHPYELPEVVAVDIDSGLPAYLDWLARETAPDTHPSREKS
ncbi:MAG TPA: divalent-cation tolerance protein CutA [Chiayiivirga sp.]|nr:divalent-cation tolerance protein CutA [Chiayiivirga sp.]